ncbi:hypothetical protein RZN22_10900 [Bacillaceae bacterium S4-13-58]
MKRYSCIIMEHVNQKVSFTTALEIIFAHGNKEISVEEKVGLTKIFFSTLSQDELWQLVLGFEVKGLRVGYGHGETLLEAEKKAQDHLNKVNSFETQV